jgi:hypothetical protein
MINQHRNSEVVRTLPSETLVGKRCWYVSAGGISTTFQLALGSKVRRAEPLVNRNHPRAYRIYEGEANLLVWCSWRLRQNRRILTSSDDAERKALNQLTKLVGARVQSVSINDAPWDLAILFDDKRVLEVFCDRIEHRGSTGDNWYLVTKEAFLTIGSGGKIYIEPRA